MNASRGGGLHFSIPQSLNFLISSSQLTTTCSSDAPACCSGDRSMRNLLPSGATSQVPKFKKGDRHVAPQSRIAGLPHLPHPAGAELRDDRVVSEGLADHCGKG